MQTKLSVDPDYTTFMPGVVVRRTTKAQRPTFSLEINQWLPLVYDVFNTV